MPAPRKRSRLNARKNPFSFTSTWVQQRPKLMAQIRTGRRDEENQLLLSLRADVTDFGRPYYTVAPLQFPGNTGVAQLFALSLWARSGLETELTMKRKRLVCTSPGICCDRPGTPHWPGSCLS